MDKSHRERFEEINRENAEFGKQWQERMKDPAFAKSHDLQGEAWACFFSKSNYDPDTALQLIIQAASMNPLYEPHVQGMKDMIERKRRVGKVYFKKTLKDMLFPILIQYGFELLPPPENEKWKIGTYFKRKTSNAENTILIGKFTRIAVFSKKREDGSSETFDLYSAGMSEEDFDYLNQDEFVAVIKKLTQVFENQIIPWFEK